MVGLVGLLILVAILFVIFAWVPTGDRATNTLVAVTCTLIALLLTVWPSFPWGR